MFILENKNPKPRMKIKWSVVIRKKVGNNCVSLKFEIINKGDRKLRPIRKARRVAVTDEITINSRGKIHCFNIEELTMNESAASCKAVIEKNQGIIPESTKIV